jgi:hypothetical protein
MTEVQFRYGDVWQHQYAIGDKLTWDRANVGDPAFRSVVVNGEAVPCPCCRADVERPCYVHIESGVIREVKPADGRYDFDGEKSFLVLHEG